MRKLEVSESGGRRNVYLFLQRTLSEGTSVLLKVETQLRRLTCRGSTNTLPELLSNSAQVLLVMALTLCGLCTYKRLPFCLI